MGHRLAQGGQEDTQEYWERLCLSYIDTPIDGLWKQVEPITKKSPL